MCEREFHEEAGEELVKVGWTRGTIGMSMAKIESRCVWSVGWIIQRLLLPSSSDMSPQSSSPSRLQSPLMHLPLLHWNSPASEYSSFKIVILLKHHFIKPGIYMPCTKPVITTTVDTGKIPTSKTKKIH